MRFLVFGAGGMAGHTVATYLAEQGHEVLGFDRVKVGYCPALAGDVRDLDAVRQLVRDGRFDSVINCIGILNQFAEEAKELAVFLNSYFPHFLAEVTKDSDTQVIQMSTDCVFSGKKGGYTETDLRDGETFYDRTKALGELEDTKNITLRNSIRGLYRGFVDRSDHPSIGEGDGVCRHGEGRRLVSSGLPGTDQ
jgi:dTDP-4-dehydrorhamnose reductase